MLVVEVFYRFLDMGISNGFSVTLLVSKLLGANCPITKSIREKSLAASVILMSSLILILNERKQNCLGYHRLW